MALRSESKGSLLLHNLYQSITKDKFKKGVIYGKVRAKKRFDKL